MQIAWSIIVNVPFIFLNILFTIVHFQKPYLHKIKLLIMLLKFIYISDFF